MTTGDKCPVNIITGFLGSGKTTLLGHILEDGDFGGTSVIINEYGSAGLDHRLIRRISERTSLLAGGCICCNRREDLVSELSDMLNAHQSGKLPLDRVIIETTGLADPAPILFSILTHPVLAHHYFVETTVVCLDSINGETHLGDNPESVRQIAAADKVVITKTDIGATERTARLKDRVFSINPSAAILEAVHGHADGSILTPENVRARFFKPRTLRNGPAHTSGVRNIAIRFDRPLDWLAFGIWLSMLLQRHGEKMLRVKGIVDVGEKGPVVLNGVQHIIHPPRHLDDWRDYETVNSQIVFIMKDIDPQCIMDSLKAFQNLIGAHPEIQEISLDPFS